MWTDSNFLNENILLKKIFPDFDVFFNPLLLPRKEFVDVLKFLNERSILYIVSYDGRTGTKIHGNLLPQSLQLQHIELLAGRSSQATLLGFKSITYESLYLSPQLTNIPIQ